MPLFVLTIIGQNIVKDGCCSPVTDHVMTEFNEMIDNRTSECGDGMVPSNTKKHLMVTDYRYGFSDSPGNQNPRFIRRLGVNGGIVNFDRGRFTLFLASVGYFVIPQLELELNLGMGGYTGDVNSPGALGYFSTGAKIHFNSTHSEKSLTPYVGCLFGAFDGPMLQFPVGLNYLSKVGLNVSLSLNLMKPFWDYPMLFPELRIGWKFNV